MSDIFFWRDMRKDSANWWCMQHCVRGQVQWLGHAIDAAAWNSARRDHGEHCRRQATKRRKRRRAPRAPPLRPLWQVRVVYSNLKPLETFPNQPRHFETRTTALNHQKRSNTSTNDTTQLWATRHKRIHQKKWNNWKQIETIETQLVQL